MKLFGFFGKSSDDDQDTSTEESMPSASSESADAPQQAPEPQSQAAVDRGATMSDVIKAVTDQFALINADSDADLRAVGAALCQIPEGMSPLSTGFSSFRHEVLHAILITGEDDGLAARAVVLNKCLTSIEDSPDLAEQGTALRILAQELQEGMLAAEPAANANGDAEAQIDPATQSTPASQGAERPAAASDPESAQQSSTQQSDPAVVETALSSDGDQDGEAEEEGDDLIDEDENDLECYLRNVNGDNARLRARTAPLRPMEHIEQFKMTPNFTNLEQAAVCAVQIVQRNDQKFDLDSFEGQNSCKKFLGFIEKLCESLKIKS